MPLTRQQLAQLVKECDERFSWLLVRDFCQMVFGYGAAVSCKIETYGEYNDEGGTDYSISNLTASNAEGKELPLNLDLAFFFMDESGFRDLQAKRKLPKTASLCPLCHQKCDAGTIDEELQEQAWDLIKEFSFPERLKTSLGFACWVAWEDLPIEEKVYDLRKEPMLTYAINPLLPQVLTLRTTAW
jgi:hypothetical protein